MPVVSVKTWDLERLLGTPVSSNTLLGVLESLKLEVESVESGTLTYEAPHDRLDLYSVEGLARAVAYQLGLRKPMEYAVSRSRIYVDSEKAPSYRPYVLMAIIKGVQLDDEAISQIFQLQERLHITHCGNRELVSIGLYDLDTIEFPVYYREVSTVKFRPLGFEEAMDVRDILEKTDKGREYGHLVKAGHYPLLVDFRSTVLSLPPIINSEDTRITTKTKNVLVDVTGTEPKLMASILTIMTAAIYERGGKSIEVVSVVGRRDIEELVAELLTGRYIFVGLRRVSNLIGVEIGVDDIVRYLESHGYLVKSVEDGGLKVWVPPYRVDVIDEDDVIEDIAISMDYNRIVGKLAPPTARGKVHPIELVTRHLRDVLVGLGLTEILNFMLTDPDYLAILGYTNYVAVENPKMRAYSVLRPSLIPGLLRSISMNVKKYNLRSIKLFEIGDVVNPDKIISTRRVAGAIYGPEVTLTDGLAIVRTMLEVLGMKPTFDSIEGLELAIRERSAVIKLGERSVGVVYEVHPRYLKYLELSAPVTVFELAVDNLVELLGIRSW